MSYPPRYKQTGYDRGMQAATFGDWCRVSDAFAEIERLRSALLEIGERGHIITGGDCGVLRDHARKALGLETIEDK